MLLIQRRVFNHGAHVDPWFPTLPVPIDPRLDDAVVRLPSSLAGAFGLGHEAVVEQRGQTPPDDRPQDVEPEAREVSRNNHRA